MADETVNKLTIDAKEYLDTLEVIKAGEASWASSQKTSVTSIAKTYDDASNLIAAALKLQINELTKVSAKYKLVDNEIDTFTATVVNSAPKIKSATEAIKEHAKSLEALKKIQSDVISQKVTAQQQIVTPRIFASVKEDITAAFAPKGIPEVANVKQIQNLGSKFSDITSIMAGGKVTFTEFTEQLDIIKNKRVVPDHAKEDINELRRLIASAGTDLINLTEKEAAAIKRSTDLAKASAKKLADEAATSTKSRALVSATAAFYPQVQESITKTFGRLSPGANLTDIQRINAAMAEVSKTIASGDVTFAQFQKQLDIVSTKQIVPPDANSAVNQLRHNLSQLGSAYEVAGVRSNAFSRTVLTATGFLRLMVTQVIHASLARLIFGFIEATKAAGEFGRQIALIQTITQDQPSTIDAWAASLTRLSNELGRPVAEVAKAAYAALSNQITKGKEDTEDFLRIIGAFSRTVGATTEESVNLFSTAIKGLGLNLDQSEKIASTFFGAIDYGRITAQSFNATLGRTVPLARDLKISLEEVAAAQAALTQVGFGPEEAGTRLTNLLLGLEKPSKDLKEFFKSFGADTGRDFIQSVGGFQKAIEAISEGAKSGAINIEQLFPELRKLQAAFGLVNDGGKAFAQILKDISGPEAEKRYAVAKKLTEETFAFKFSKQMEELKNAAITLGTTFQQKFIAISDAIGGVATRLTQIVDLVYKVTFVSYGYFAVSKGYELLAPEIIKLSVAFYSLTTGIKVTEAATVGLGTAFKFTNAQIAGMFAAGYIATKSILDFVEASKQARLDEASKKFKLELEINDKSFKAGLNKVTEEIIKQTDAWQAEYARASNKMTIILEQELEKQKEDLKDLGKTVENVFKGVTDILGQGVHNLESAARKASDAANETAKNIQEIQRESHDKEIEFQRELAKAQYAAAGGEGTGRNEEVIVLNEIIRLQKIAGEHAKEEAIDPTKIGQAKKDIQDAIKLLDSLKGAYISAATTASKTEFTAPKDTGIKGIIQSQLESIKQAQSGLIVPTEETNKYTIENSQANQLYGNIYSWKQKIAELTKQLINIENQQNAAQTKNSIKLQEVARQQKVALDDAIDAYKKFSDFSFIDKITGKARVAPPIYGGDQSKFIKDELAKAQNLLKDAEDKISKLFDSLLAQSQAGLKGRPDLLEIAGKLREELHRKAIDFGEGKIDVGKAALHLKDLEEELSLQKQITDQIKQKINFTKEDLENKKKSISASQQEASELINALKEGSASIDIVKLQDLFRQFNANPPDFFKNAPQLIKQLEDILAKSKTPVSEKSALGMPIGPAEIPARQFVKAAEGTITAQKTPGGEIQVSQAITNLIEGVKNIAKLQPEIEGKQLDLNVFRARLNTMGEELGKVPGALHATSEIFSNFAESIKGKTGDINIVLGDLINAIHQNTERLNTISTSPVPAPLPTVTPEAKEMFPSIFKSMGGLIGYYSNGGMFKPKGTDVIPAMLSKGEYVVSAKGAGMFLEELKLMNKGIDPFKMEKTFMPQAITQTRANSVYNNTKYFSQGSSTTIGDVNIHMHDNQKNPQLGVNIGNQIRRELRRGNLKF